MEKRYMKVVITYGDGGHSTCCYDTHTTYGRILTSEEMWYIAMTAHTQAETIDVTPQHDAYVDVDTVRVKACQIRLETVMEGLYRKKYHIEPHGELLDDQDHIDAFVQNELLTFDPAVLTEEDGSMAHEPTDEGQYYREDPELGMVMANVPLDDFGGCEEPTQDELEERWNDKQYALNK